MKAYYRHLAKEYRRKMTPAQRASSLRRSYRPRPIRYPHKAEGQVYVTVRNIYSQYSSRIIDFLKARYPNRNANDSFNQDDFGTEFNLFMRKIEKEFEASTVSAVIAVDLSRIMTRIANFILQFNEEEVAAYMKEITGVPFYGTVEWWDALRESWVNQATTRVAGNVNKFYTSTREMVFEAVKANKTFEEVLEMIKAADESLTEKKAEFLARDLTGELNGEVERNLQLSIGISEYLWQTMNDEKVRGKPGGAYPDAIPSHWSIDSRVCSWSDSSIVSLDAGRTWVQRTELMPRLHPGMDWQCRCRGTPFSAELLRKLDEEIAKERERANAVG